MRKLLILSALVASAAAAGCTSSNPCGGGGGLFSGCSLFGGNRQTANMECCDPYGSAPVISAPIVQQPCCGS